MDAINGFFMDAIKTMAIKWSLKHARLMVFFNGVPLKQHENPVKILRGILMIV